MQEDIILLCKDLMLNVQLSYFIIVNYACLLVFSFDPRAFRWAQTMRLAVEEINHSTQLLPNHTLGYTIFDSCAYPLTGQRAALAVLNRLIDGRAPICNKTSPLLAVIGESGSAQSIVVSRILQPFKIPMVMTLFVEKLSNESSKNFNYFISRSFICPYFEDQLLFIVCMSV